LWIRGPRGSNPHLWGKESALGGAEFAGKGVSNCREGSPRLVERSSRGRKSALVGKRVGAWWSGVCGEGSPLALFRVRPTFARFAPIYLFLCAAFTFGFLLSRPLLPYILFNSFFYLKNLKSSREREKKGKINLKIIFNIIIYNF